MQWRRPDPARHDRGRHYRPGDTRVGGDHRRLVSCLQAGVVVHVNGPGAGINHSLRSGHDGVRQFLPVQQVATDRVSPGDIAPVPVVGIVLKEEMPLPLAIGHAVGVVEPAAPGAEVELGAQGFVIHIFHPRDRVGQGDLGQRRQGVRRQFPLDAQDLAPVRGQIREHPEIRRALGQLDIGIGEQGFVSIEEEAAIRFPSLGLALHGPDEVAFVDRAGSVNRLRVDQPRKKKAQDRQVVFCH